MHVPAVTVPEHMKKQFAIDLLLMSPGIVLKGAPFNFQPFRVAAEREFRSIVVPQHKERASSRSSITILSTSGGL